MRFSIIIPAYNEEKHLSRIVKTLREQISDNFEIVIVDNNSKDRTFKIAKKIADKAYLCRNQGSSHARNHAALRVKSDVVAFLDADTIPCKNWSSTIEKAFNKDKKLTAITGLDLYEHKNPFKWLIINIYSTICCMGVKCFNILGKPTITANNFAIRREIFNKIGGLDNVVVEDYYFSLKLRKLHDIKCLSNFRMIAELSSRRFDKKGFFKLIFYWAKAMFKKVPLDTYTRHDEL